MDSGAAMSVVQSRSSILGFAQQSDPSARPALSSVDGRPLLVGGAVRLEKGTVRLELDNGFVASNETHLDLTVLLSQSDDTRPDDTVYLSVPDANRIFGWELGTVVRGGSEVPRVPATPSEVDEIIKQLGPFSQEIPNITNFVDVFADRQQEHILGWKAQVRQRDVPLSVPAPRSRTFSPDKDRLARQEIEMRTKLGHWAYLPENVFPLHCAPLLIGVKENGEIRPLINYTLTNAYVEPSPFLLPRIQDEVQRLPKYTIWSSLDLRSGFSQLLLDQSSAMLLVFRYDARTYLYPKRLPQGLNASPGIFHRTIAAILAGTQDPARLENLFEPGPDGSVLLYLDDTLLGSMGREQHARLWEKVLKRFALYNVHIKPTKVEMAKAEVDFVGMRLSEKGLALGSKHAQRVEFEFTTPNTERELHTLYHALGYCRRNAIKYATVMAPITDLYVDLGREARQRKGKTRPASIGDYSPSKKLGPRWTSECQLALEEIVRILKAEILITFVDTSLLQCLITDASNEGYGAVLCQFPPEQRERLPMDRDLGILACASGRWTGASMRYSTPRQEIWTVRYALRKFEHLLLPRPLELFVDNKATQLGFRLEPSRTSATAPSSWILPSRSWNWLLLTRSILRASQTSWRIT